MLLNDARVVVTGGAGFLGSHVVERFYNVGAKVYVPRQEDYDLRVHGDVLRMYRDMSPEIVVHLAAAVGGIGANQVNPGSFFFDNAIMGLHVIHEAKNFGVQKLIQVGTVCAYPNAPSVPFQETDLWNGYPEPTNAPYGIAKRMLLEMLQAYRKQYGFCGIYLLPTNLYGPRDNFDLNSSHVIPALIRKCVEAKAAGAPSISVWGTGAASREFLYVDDCAEAIVLATERYDGPEPVNVGTGVEIGMHSLVAAVKMATGYEGTIEWDHSKPDGQPRRCLDVSRAKELMGFVAKTRLESGILSTVEWYQENKQCSTPICG